MRCSAGHAIIHQIIRNNNNDDNNNSNDNLTHTQMDRYEDRWLVRSSNHFLSIGGLALHFFQVHPQTAPIGFLFLKLPPPPCAVLPGIQFLSSVTRPRSFANWCPVAGQCREVLSRSCNTGLMKLVAAYIKIIVIPNTLMHHVTRGKRVSNFKRR